MSNSTLAKKKQISQNKNTPRNHTIDRITPHVYVGEQSADNMLYWFSLPSAECSCNYVIDRDGVIGLCVDEKDRSWCSSSSANDNRAVTIECASGSSYPYTINSKVYASLIDLMADICKRNGKKKLLWFNDKDKSLNYEPKADEMIITLHRWFAAKECPGQYIIDHLPDIVKKVNEKLVSTSSGSSEKKYYRVQVGAFENKEYAERLRDELIKKGYKDAYVRE